MRYQPLVIVFTAMSCGILGDRFWPWGIGWWWCAAALGLGVWFWLRWRGREGWSSWPLVLAVAASAAAWHHFRWHLYEADELGRAACQRSQPMCVEGVALTAPRWSQARPLDPLSTIPRGEQSRLTVRVTAVRDGASWRRVSGRTELTVEGRLKGVAAGDRLRIFALLRAYSAPLNPGEYDFGQRQRARRQLGALRASDPAAVRVISRGWPCSPRRVLCELRQRGCDVLQRCVGAPRADLASAILLGARERLSREETDGFLETGTMHILAISGLHVGILASGFFLATRLGWFSRRSPLYAAALFAIFYAVLTDARPPIVRAAILITLMCGARLLGKPALAYNTLAAAGIVVLALDPTALLQTGPQLSFLAVATLARCAPLLTPRPSRDPLKRLLSRTRPWPVRAARRLGSGLARLWLTSAVIWLATLPLVAYRFHIISMAALVVNPILWLPVACALFSGFGALLLGGLIPPAGWFFGGICSASLAAVEVVIHAAGGVRGAYFWTAGPPLWWVLLSYAGWGVLAAWPRRLLPRAAGIGLLIAWLAVWWCAARTSPHRLRGEARGALACTFLAVGHGACVVLELPDGRTLMYDAGRLGSPSSSVRPIASFLWSRGIGRVDALVISHADADHFNAIPALMERFSIGDIYAAPGTLDQSQPAVSALRDAILSSRSPLHLVVRGDRLPAPEGVCLEVLHPPPEGVAGGDNAQSVVLRIECAGRTILLTGDLEAAGLERLLAESPQRCDVLMAPHHGSGRSRPEDLAAWSSPRCVVVSGALADGDRAVEFAYRARGADVFHTAQSGAVRIVLAKKPPRVKTWRRDPW